VEFGSIDQFVATHHTGLSAESVARLYRIADSEEFKAKEDIAFFDSVTCQRDIDDVLAEIFVRNQNQTPEERGITSKRLIRCQQLVRALKDKHQNRCQVETCRFTFKKENGTYYSEVAHIKPMKSREIGIDVPDNIQILCPNHHKMLDFGAMIIMNDSEVEINGEKVKILK